MSHPGASGSAERAPAPIAEIRDISKAFGATVALRGVSLTFRPGEIHCLLGENGAGKSTVGKVLGGFHRADSGEMRVDGRPLSIGGVAEARSLGIATVFQELSLAPDLSVRENLFLGTEGGGRFGFVRRRSEMARSRAFLETLGLSVDPATRTGDLPVATQQLIEIAKALLSQPRLVILDEPTAMLGAVEKAKLFQIVDRLKRGGTGFIFITHHLNEVLEIGDRVSVMRDGALVDSFPLTQAVTEDQILEKISGRKVAAPRRAARDGLGSPLLRIEGLIGRDDSPAEITIHEGETVGLYGVVGCGYEQIIGAITGLGARGPISMTIGGAPYRPGSPADAARRGIAHLPTGRAANGILPSRPIRENLTLSQLRRFRRGGLVSARAERAEATRQFGMLGVKLASPEDPITALSGGNQQKVLFGRILGRGRSLLVLEDPTAGIDVAAKAELHALIRARTEQGTAVLIVSSDLHETIALCDTIHTLFAGRLMRRYRPPHPDHEPAIIADVLGSAVPAPGEDHDGF